MIPKVGQRYRLHNQPGVVVTVLRVWSEYNPVHSRYTEYVEERLDYPADSGRKSCEQWQTRGNWDLGLYNLELIPEGDQ